MFLLDFLGLVRVVCWCCLGDFMMLMLGVFCWVVWIFVG